MAEVNNEGSKDVKKSAPLDFTPDMNDSSRMNQSLAREQKVRKSAGNIEEKEKEQAEKDLLKALRPQRIEEVMKYLLTEDDRFTDKGEKLADIQFVEAINLPEKYKKAYDFMHDDRLAGTMIAIVPDAAWGNKGEPSESVAQHDLILIKASYFKGNDDIGWMAHELGHCQRFKDKPEGKDYEKDMGTYAFDDLQSVATYPNNMVEAHAFLRQFQFLKQEGRKRGDILAMLKKDYSGETSENDFRFFNKLLDRVFK